MGDFRYRRCKYAAGAPRSSARKLESERVVRDYKRHITRYEKKKDERKVSDLTVELSGFYVYVDEPEEALTILKKLHGKTDDRRRRSEVALSIGGIYMRSVNDYKQAAKLVQESASSSWKE